MPKTGCLSVPRPLFGGLAAHETEYLLFFGYLVEINQPPEGQKVPVHGLSVQLQEQSGSGSVNVDAKAFNDFSDFVSAQPAVFKHFSSLSGDSLMV